MDRNGRNGLKWRSIWPKWTGRDNGRAYMPLRGARAIAGMRSRSPRLGDRDAKLEIARDIDAPITPGSLTRADYLEKRASFAPNACG